MKILAKSFNVSNGSFNVVIQNDSGTKPYVVDKSHSKYDLLKEAFVKSDAKLFLELYEAKNVENLLINKYVGNSGIVVNDDSVTYNGEVVHNTYVNRILEMKKAKLPIQPMVNFLENLLKNPSNRSKNELPDFLANKNLPFTEDGCFLAYKSVDSNYWSKRGGELKLTSGTVNESGKIFNGVGEVIRCNRSEVDDERGNECSHGLHVGGLEYSGPNGFYYQPGDKIVIVKVNPADVVSVPKDHQAQKVRVCAYTVIGEYTNPLRSEAVKTENYSAEEDNWDDDYEDEDEDDSDDVEVNDIECCITISFDYKGERRYLLVDDYDSMHVEGYVTKGDPSYDDASDEYRSFLKANMSNVKFVY